MSTLDLSKESTREPAELVDDIALSDEALAMLPTAANAHAYILALSEDGLFNDALLVLARTLPRQFAILWASRCVEDELPAQLGEDQRRCLEQVKTWLGGPGEDIRRACQDQAEACDYDDQFAWLAAAVGFSGGSLAPKDQVAVPPPDNLTAIAVCACLLYLANQDQEKLAENANQIIERGLAMAAIPGS